MSTLYQPVPTGIGLPLAGSAEVKFDRVMVRRAGQAPQVRGIDDIPQAALDRLTALRPPVAGLQMDRPMVMGIVNVTPDSFSDGGDYATLDRAVATAARMAEVADILDIGGESTRPGAAEVEIAEEIDRTAPVIAAIRAAGITTPISIDTRKARVAEAALDAGADIVNDVSAFLFDPDLMTLTAERGVPCCLMHAQGLPADMQNDPRYGDVLTEVFSALAGRITAATAAGIDPARIIADVGIGFGKTVQHNVTLMRHLALYHDLGVGLLLGASRKRFIGTIGHAPEAKDRLGGSLAVALQAAEQGAQILRVHDVEQTVQALRLHRAMKGFEEYDT